MRLPVLLGAGAQGHAALGEHVGEQRVLLGAQHPAAVDGRIRRLRHVQDRPAGGVPARQAVVVDDADVQPRGAGGGGLRGEVLVGSARAQRIGRYQHHHVGYGTWMSALEFTTDAARFLAAADDHLAADPVLSTVVTANAHRSRSWPAGGPPRHFWWLVVRDGAGAVVGVGMRTAPVAPYPLYLLPMPDDAAVELGRVLHERGEETLAVNGALPAAQRCAAELARLAGGRVEVQVHTRLHELGEVTPPAPVPGRLAVVTEDDVDMANLVVVR
ncbi:hypothetical protein AB0K00_13755 [Dactylosporangium sp. NPDC049525]|uniref:hypothetical protein n=1 Tax=Dactylosporangium sp. NPDC049525 TaxID=3154730 RepID=UPI003433FFF3